MVIKLITDIKRGIQEAKCGNTSVGLELFQNAASILKTPEAKAWFGYCLVVEENYVQTGIALCQEALIKNPKLSDGYLALGKIYLHKGNRKQAIEILQQGLKEAQDHEILMFLESIGARKKPPFPFLSRNHGINIFLGRLLARLGLR